MKNLKWLSRKPGIQEQIKEIINGVIEEGNTVILVKFENGENKVRKVRNAPSNVKILIDFDNLFVYKNGVRYCFPKDVARIIAQRLGNIKEIKEIYSGIRLRSYDKKTGILGFTFIEPGSDFPIDVPFEKIL
jgi:hypothetical protein